MTIVDGTYKCVRGDMPLSRSLHDSLSEVFVARTRAARSHAWNWGGPWFCPGCGVPATAEAKHVRCEKCGEYLDEFLRRLVELHPHRPDDWLWCFENGLLTEKPIVRVTAVRDVEAAIEFLLFLALDGPARAPNPNMKRAWIRERLALLPAEFRTVELGLRGDAFKRVKIEGTFDYEIVSAIEPAS